MLNSFALPTIVLFALMGTAEPELIARGGDDSQGRLVNLSVGSAANSPIDGDKPTFVITHGFNPCPRLFRFTFPRTYAQAIRRRWGAEVNVLAWEWNAATLTSLRPSVNEANAVGQGRRLAAELIERGARPECTQLIGHSLGCVVMASAAESLCCSTSRAVARLTLLDPLESQHRLIFVRLRATSTTVLVENIWAPGLSGYGAVAEYPGVVNLRIPGATPVRGAINPLQSNHLYVIRWHLDLLRAQATVTPEMWWPWIVEDYQAR